MATSLLHAVLQAMEKEERDYSLETGRGRAKGGELHLQRVGHSKGLLRAIEIVKEQAKAINAEED